MMDLGVGGRMILSVMVCVMLAAFGSGRVSRETLSALSQKRGRLGARLCADVCLLIAAAAVIRLFGGVSRASSAVFCAAEAVLLLPAAERLWGYVCLPMAVLAAARGAALPIETVAGGLAGLCAAAVAELCLNRAANPKIRRALRLLSAAAFGLLSFLP